MSLHLQFHDLQDQAKLRKPLTRRVCIPGVHHDYLTSFNQRKMRTIQLPFPPKGLNPGISTEPQCLSVMPTIPVINGRPTPPTVPQIKILTTLISSPQSQHNPLMADDPLQGRSRVSLPIRFCSRGWAVVGIIP